MKPIDTLRGCEFDADYKQRYCVIIINEASSIANDNYAALANEYYANEPVGCCKCVNVQQLSEKDNNKMVEQDSLSRMLVHSFLGVLSDASFRLNLTEHRLNTVQLLPDCCQTIA